LQNGIFFYNFFIKDKKKVNVNLFVYCIKDEKTEDVFLCDINHIETINHSSYDNLPQVPGDASAMQKANSDNGKQMKAKSEDLNTIKEISAVQEFSDQSEKKYTKEKISGIQNRALTLESLVNYYFKKFDLISLPDLIFNISEPKERIFLYREWDGAFMNQSQKDISYEDLKFLLPFNDEKKLLIKDKLTEINKKLIIHKNSIIFIEVKMEFPKKKEIIKNKKNLEKVIEDMIEKVNYFMKIYSKIFIELNIQNIQLLLLYNNNRIINYQDTIETYIAQHKKLIKEYYKNYNVYFHILYIYPSIGKIALNEISAQISNMEESQKQNKIEIEELKKQNKIEIEELKKQNKIEIEELKKQNKIEIEELKKQNQNKIEELKKIQQEKESKIKIK